MLLPVGNNKVDTPEISVAAVAARTRQWQAGRQAGRQTGRQAGRQTDRQTDGQTM